MRKFLGLFTVSALLLALCFSVEAQQAKKVPRIGFVVLGFPSTEIANRDAFREGLRELGYIEGQNIVVEFRYAEGSYERLPDLAGELVRLKLEVIVAGGTEAIRAAKNATGTIPIVMAVSSDPLGSGLIASLAKPGGNVTGLSFMSPELNGKRVELFRETFPKLRRLAVLWTARSDYLFRETQTAANNLGLKILSLEVRNPEDLDSAFA